MPLTQTFSQADGLLLVTASGVISRDDIERFNEGLIADPTIRPGMRMLFDATDADPAVKVSELRDAAAQFRTVAERGIRRMAIAAPRGLVSGLAHVYSLFADAEGFEVQVFESVDEARSWLSQNESE